MGLLIIACSSAGERRAEQPEAPSDSEESDGFSGEQKQELSELLGVDVEGDDQDAGSSEQAPPAP